MSDASPTLSPASLSRSEQALAWLLGQHGLALMVVFPLGPQSARLWQPGVAGFAALTCAFPLAAALGGLLARRLPARALPASPRALALLACAGALPSAFSGGFEQLLVGRALAGLLTGVSFVAIHRLLPPAVFAHVARVAPRVVAFGLPPAILAATALDWRAAFAAVAGLALAIAVAAPRAPSARLVFPSAEAAPAGLLATAALAFVTAAYLTVLSGFLVFNAGHTEWHIPAALLLAALLGLGVPPLLARLRRRLAAAPLFLATLLASSLLASGLLALRAPLPAALALALIAGFLAINAARHLALGGVVNARLATEERPAHQLHTHLAHHLGAGLGAVCAALVVRLDPAAARLVGMPALLACALLATATAATAGLLPARVVSALALRLRWSRRRRPRPAPPRPATACASRRP